MGEVYPCAELNKIWTCECRHADRYRQMTHTAIASYYPKSGLFRYKNQLLDTIRTDGPGWHFWHAFAHHPPGVRSVECKAVNTQYLLSMRVDGRQHGIGVFLKRVWPMRPIQRLIRRFLARRRALACAMAMHSRLGEDSGLTCLPGDLVCTIVQKLLA